MRFLALALVLMMLIDQDISNPNDNNDHHTIPRQDFPPDNGNRGPAKPHDNGNSGPAKPYENGMSGKAKPHE
nr:hypothetical protein CFP56_72260 [Quercus suber]